MKYPLGIFLCVSIVHPFVHPHWYLSNHLADWLYFVNASLELGFHAENGASRFVTSVHIQISNLICQKVSDHYLINCYMDSVYIFTVASSWGPAQLISIPKHLTNLFTLSSTYYLIIWEASAHYPMNCYMNSLHNFTVVSSQRISELIYIPTYLTYFCIGTEICFIS